MNASTTRIAFAGATAIAAAAFVDPLVEWLSNIGTFGAGRFSDGSNADVIPTLAVAAALCILFVTLSARSVWATKSATHLDAASIWRLLPLIFAMQLGVLFTMETLEQLIVVSHLFGGTVWLGGPVLVSLSMHFVGGAILAFALSWILQAAARHVVHAVRLVLGFAVGRNIDCAATIRTETIETSRLIKPLIRRLKGRAPPLPAV